MVPILDCNSEIDAHKRSNLFYLSCLRYAIKSRAVKILIFPQGLFIYLLINPIIPSSPPKKKESKTDQTTPVHLVPSGDDPDPSGDDPDPSGDDPDPTLKKRPVSTLKKNRIRI